MHFSQVQDSEVRTDKLPSDILLHSPLHVRDPPGHRLRGFTPPLLPLRKVIKNYQVQLLVPFYFNFEQLSGFPSASIRSTKPCYDFGDIRKSGSNVKLNALPIEKFKYLVRSPQMVVVSHARDSLARTLSHPHPWHWISMTLLDLPRARIIIRTRWTLSRTILYIN